MLQKDTVFPVHITKTASNNCQPLSLGLLFLPCLTLTGSVLQPRSWHLKNDHPSSLFYDEVQREPGSPPIVFDVKDVRVILALSSRERGSELVWEGQVY